MIAWRKEAAHVDAKELDAFRIKKPNRGFPDLGKKMFRRPPCSGTRKAKLASGMMVAVCMKDEAHPLFIAQILKVFRDNKHGATWLRVNWWEPLSGKFCGTYRANPHGPGYAGNLLVTPLKGLKEVDLIHWSTPTDKHQVMTKGDTIAEGTLKAARADVRMSDPDTQRLLCAKLKKHTKNVVCATCFVEPVIRLQG